MALHDFYDLSERKRIARGEFNSTQVQLRELLEETGARRVEVECGGVGLCHRNPLYKEKSCHKETAPFP